jgi:hypothetical protein
MRIAASLTLDENWIWRRCSCPSAQRFEIGAFGRDKSPFCDPNGWTDEHALPRLPCNAWVSSDDDDNGHTAGCASADDPVLSRRALAVDRVAITRDRADPAVAGHSRVCRCGPGRFIPWRIGPRAFVSGKMRQNATKAAFIANACSATGGVRPRGRDEFATRPLPAPKASTRIPASRSWSTSDVKAWP